MRFVIALLLLLVFFVAPTGAAEVGKKYRFGGLFCNEAPHVETLIYKAKWKGVVDEEAVPQGCVGAEDVLAEFLGSEQVITGNQRFEIIHVRIHDLHPAFFLELLTMPIEKYLYYVDTNYVGA